MNLQKVISLNKENIVIKLRDKKGYIYNKSNNKNIFLDKEIIQYLVQAAEKKMLFSEFINAFYDKDKPYIENLLDILTEMNLFDQEKLIEKCVESIHMALTYKCNLECKHCWLECSPRKKTSLFLEDWKKVIDKISYLKPKILVFTGGEPLILDYFMELVFYSKKKLPETKFVLSTNGVLINSYSGEFFKSYFQKIDISIDGYDCETSDKIRGIGTFNKVIDNIKMLKKEGFNNINLSLTQGDLNIDNRDKFRKLCNELGVGDIIRTFTPIGRGKDNSDMFLSKQTTLPLSIIQLFEYACNCCKKDNDENGKVSAVACDAGEKQIFIDDRSNVYPCPSLCEEKFKITDMLSGDCINDILKFKGGYDIYQSIILQREKCNDCDLNIFCWHCPAHFDRAYNSNELDYWCKKAKKYLDKIIWNEG